MPENQSPIPALRKMRIAQMKKDLARLEKEEEENAKTAHEVARESRDDPETRRKYRM